MIVVAPDVLARRAVDELGGHHEVAFLLPDAPPQFETRLLTVGDEPLRVPVRKDSGVVVPDELRDELVLEPGRHRQGSRVPGGNLERNHCDRGPGVRGRKELRPARCRPGGGRGKPASGLGLAATGSGASVPAGFHVAEDGDVAPLGQVYPDRVSLSRQEVVALEGPPQAAGLDPHDGVEQGVEIVLAPEHLGGKGHLRQLFAAAGEGLVHHETEEVAGTPRRVEVGTQQDPLELLSRGSGQRHFPCFFTAVVLFTVVIISVTPCPPSARHHNTLRLSNILDSCTPFP